jgi:hypothetical protein
MHLGQNRHGMASGFKNRRWIRVWQRLGGSLSGAFLMVAAVAADARVEFNRDVRPILAEHCLNCHGFDEKTRKGGLRLDVREDALRGGKSGKGAIRPGHLIGSELIQRIRTADPDDQMPPPESGNPLSPAQIQVLEKWVAQGGDYQAHWAFIPPERPTVPEVKQAGWARSALDNFVQARLEKEGLTPAPEADRVSLIRRATLDLTGLPPSLGDIDAFLSDPDSDAYEKVVDRLLASAQYGERMAVDWMDAARYADTHGYHIDSARDMTAWRDGVMDAFNRNQSFDQFTLEQLAGDLLPEATPAQKVASGFNRNHMINYEGGAIADEYLNAYIVDRINTTTTVWMGLTVACAQCHDHKYDPITMRDYYGLYAIFNGVPENGLDGRHGNAVPVVRLPTRDQQEELGRLRAVLQTAESRLAQPPAEVVGELEQWKASLSEADILAGLPEPLRNVVALAPESRSAEQASELEKHFKEKVSVSWKRLRDEVADARKAVEGFEKAIPTSMVMGEMAQPRDSFILVRGQYDQKGDKVGRALPSALPGLPDADGADRLTLARWLINPRHPLTARVTVNRYWQMFFGNGLVKSSENFGTQGDLPTHPELLDWLATEFIRTGWDMKRLHRTILTSSTYRQASRVGRERYERDPENRWLGRGPRFRLQAEFLRDLALDVSGLLDPRIGGAAVFPYQPAGLWEELMSRQDNDAFTAQKYVTSKGSDLYRRTLYTFIKRTSPHPSLSNFDAPDRQVCSVRRPRTNTPLQALALMNDPTYVEAARKLAERVMEAAPDSRRRIIHGFRLATGRVPSDREIQLLQELYEAQLAGFRAHPYRAGDLLKVGESAVGAVDHLELAAWTVVANAILNLDETLTKG